MKTKTKKTKSIGSECTVGLNAANFRIIKEAVDKAVKEYREAVFYSGIPREIAEVKMDLMIDTIIKVSKIYSSMNDIQDYLPKGYKFQ